MLQTFGRSASRIRFQPLRFTLQSQKFQRFYTKDSNNDQIFIHPEANSLFKVSLSPEENALHMGHSKGQEITPSNFKDNDVFLELLHSEIAKDVQNDFAFIMEAGTFANSFMPIYDFREIPSYGRIPEVDNIFGYVHVNENGKIIPGSYEPNNMYRLCNGTGLPRLSDHLYSVIKKKCETTV